MSIPVYKTEIDDGLLESIKSQASIAFLSPIKIVEPTESQKASATVTLKDSAIAAHIPNLVQLSEHSWDLHYLNSILASIGWNENDDVFDAGESWNARHTPVYKQVNWMHNETDIIGNIIASIVVDHEGNIIPDNAEQTPSLYDIIVASVLYKRWDNPALQERMDNIIESISKGELFVSMECLFRNFDYALITPSGEHKVIARNAETAFLTKHLRIYKGTGTWNGNKIGRLLRNFTFSGKGIVTNPANKRSFILTDNVNPFVAKSTTILTEPVNKVNNNMADNDTIVQSLKDELAKANARTEKLETQLNKMVEDARKNEQEKVEKEIASLKVDVDDLNKKIVAQTADITAKEDSIKELQKQLKEANDNVAEANKKLEAAKVAEVKASRIAKLVAAGVDTAAAEKVADKWASASDEQFEDIVALHKKGDGKSSATDANDKNKNKGQETVGDMDSAEAEEDVDGAIDGSETSDDLIASTASYLGSLLNKKDEE